MPASPSAGSGLPSVGGTPALALATPSANGPQALMPGAPAIDFVATLDDDSPALSADGRFVAFSSLATDLVAGDTNGVADIFVRDRLTGTTERVSVAADGTQANQESRRPALSADGRHVAFYSLATNLVAGGTNGVADLFVRDRVTGAIERVNVASTQPPVAGFPPIMTPGAPLAPPAADASNVLPIDADPDASVPTPDLEAPVISDRYA